jgi:hypothetical protein
LERCREYAVAAWPSLTDVVPTRTSDFVIARATQNDVVVPSASHPSSGRNAADLEWNPVLRIVIARAAIDCIVTSIADHQVRTFSTVHVIVPVGSEQEVIVAKAIYAESFRLHGNATAVNVVCGFGSVDAPAPDDRVD